MKICFLYGSETGTAKEVAENLAFAAHQKPGVSCFVAPADSIPVEQWPSHSPLVIVCSTAGQGDAPQTIIESWECLRMCDAPTMAGLSYAIFGLGDSSYLKFNFLAKMLHNRLQQLGGVPLVTRGLGDDEDAGGYAEELMKWTPSLWLSLGLEDLSSKVSDAQVIRKYRVVQTNSAPSTVNDARGTVCRVAENKRLTSEDHFQTVHHIEFDRPASLHLSVLCAVGVWPVNSNAAIERLASACGHLPADVVTVHMNDHDGEFVTVDDYSSPFLDRPITVSELLGAFFDLEAAASRTFLRALATVANDDEERERLIELAADDHLIEHTDYCYREKRNCLEVIHDFSSCAVTLELVLSFLPPLRPRYFSISSSPTNETKTFSLTVAKLEFVSPMKRQREGLCSSQLCQAAVGDCFECCVKDSACVIPEGNPPLLLIGPGTGIAPIRSLVREFKANTIVLYRGFRFSNKDNLYEDEWNQAKTERGDKFCQHVAVSRENNSMRYVHHHMVQEANAREIATLIQQNGVIFVCGNSKQMPKDVERALTSIGEVLVPELGSNLLKVLKREGRYFMDTWS